ncbi:prolyl tripeptidyl peptidase [alpha proteobacterium Q-1]|nr:prolyl tripeptidyl peptidase [alpha proteobacterium Q-1]
MVSMVAFFKALVGFVFLMGMMMPAFSYAEDLTIARMVGSPALDGPKVNGLKLAPDGSRVTFLKGKERDFRIQDLWEYHIETGETRLLVDSDDILGGVAEDLSEVEKARRERQRISASGIVQYQFSKDGQSLLFPLGGDLHVYDIKAGKAKRLTETEGFETDAKFSPKGAYVSFIRDQNLFVVNVKNGVEKQLTHEGSGPVLMGMAEFVAQEEMDRDTGYWWAPDESHIAFTRVDESPVQVVDRYELSENGGVTTIAQRYPFAGTANVLIELGVVSLESGEIDWINLGEEKDIYLARVNWLPDSRHLAFQRESRDQKRLDLVFSHISSGKQWVAITERAESWINLHHDLKFLENSDRFIWSSEKSGFRHLYLHDLEGREIGALTAGDWVAAKLERVDGEAGAVYFSGFKDGPTERHLYQATLEPDPQSITRLTKEEGWHDISLSDDASVFVDSYSAPRTPPRVALKTIKGDLVTWIEKNELDADHPYAPFLDHHATSSFGTIKAEDGTDLYYELMKPADFDEAKTYPAIINVYGGPGVQRVRKSWSIDFDQILTRNGYIVLKLDNRGSANRGKAFEDVLYRKMGHSEVIDQVAGAKYLAAQDYIDGARIGVYGWSYGGYMTIHLLAQAPDVFKAGMSVAPVSDWRLYDTHYTERYLGQPDAKDEASKAGRDVYAEASVFGHLGDMKPNSLRLVHGMADDNVFFDHAVKLMSVLQNEGIGFELMTYPGKKHRISGEATRAHLWSGALDFFDRKLKP